MWIVATLWRAHPLSQEVLLDNTSLEPRLSNLYITWRVELGWMFNEICDSEVIFSLGILLCTKIGRRRENRYVDRDDSERGSLGNNERICPP